MAQNIVSIASDLYGFLLASEGPVMSRRDAAAAIRTELAEAADRLTRHIAAERDRVTTLVRARFDEAASTLRAMVDEFRESHPAEERLEQLWRGLGNTYEALRAHVRRAQSEIPRGLALGAIKPRNYARNIFHVVMALTGVLTYEFLLDRTGVIALTGALFAAFLIMEVMKRASETWNKRFVDGAFKHISRPGEAHQIPAATWYVLALFIGTITMPKEAIQLGTLALGFGDPAAQIIGKRFGRRKLVGQKSVAGTAAFIVVAGLASAIFLGAVLPSDSSLASPLALLGFAALLGFVGSLAELFSGPIDDNFTIPIATGAVATLFLLV